MLLSPLTATVLPLRSLAVFNGEFFSTSIIDVGLAVE